MSEYEQLCKDFISKPKSLLIAPAGYGKSHTIVECLKYTRGTQLVLTHTHAGIASLKEKVKNIGIAGINANIETIDSYAQKYVNAFYCGKVPEQDSKDFFSFIIQKATQIVKLNPIKDIIKLSYTGLFVDEYQDCTLNQHQFITALSEILPLHILGDPLQGIFDFNDEKVINLESIENDNNFACFELSEPWRWKKCNEHLGVRLKDIREKLKNNEIIDLTFFNDAIEVEKIEEADIYSWDRKYNKKIRELLKLNQLLIIDSESHNFNVRKKLVKSFNNTFSLIEAIDHKDFYDLSKKFDNSDSNPIYIVCRDVVYMLFNKTELDKWFNDTDLKKKISQTDKNIQAPIKDYFNSLNNKISFLTVSKLMHKIYAIPGLKCYRKELFFDLCRALEQAEYHKTTVYEAMRNIRNTKRRVGRKIKDKCIGTTLLTKGLEFETVVILNAHKFKCPKNLYVALTRASKRLVVFTNNLKLNPY